MDLQYFPHVIIKYKYDTIDLTTNKLTHFPWLIDIKIK